MSCAQLPTGPTLHLAHLPFPHCRITQTTSQVDRTWGFSNSSLKTSQELQMFQASLFSQTTSLGERTWEIFNFSLRNIARIANV